ncbi:glycosyltransferase [Limnothrix sp. FACHB-406]|uniref:glycosyltransferase n=1 Tax=Limnothrix sp. FACHB-406 TaxID=2692817 RepID=UPI001682D9DD|nr:glycosyltransferase [Limnothrix sp. FACHB-406]MBD2590111.1 glycosyltransferase [Limnothrix sp. FACHB-406]
MESFDLGIKLYGVEGFNDAVALLYRDYINLLKTISKNLEHFLPKDLMLDNIRIENRSTTYQGSILFDQSDINFEVGKQKEHPESMLQTQCVVRMTVIVSVYCSELFFEGLLKDLVAQTSFRRKEIELIVIDSASPENEQEIIRRFIELHPDQIRYYRSHSRETIYAAWNRAIQGARGKYLINANADDRLRPDAIEVMARYLDEHPDVAMVYPYQLITDIPNETFETTQANRVFNWTTFNPEWLAQGYNLGSHLMWRASLHQKYGYFRPDLKSAGDYEFVLRIAKTEKIVCIPEVLGLYYNNQQGLSMNIAAALPETRRVQAEYGFHYNDVPLYQTQLSSHCRVLVITNLYPPQELGGYGRSLADFAAGLQSRGHQIHVLTSDAPYLGRTPDREDGIDRRLQLWGTYEGQTQELQDPNQINAIVAHNDRILREVLAQLQPNLCLVGNISFLGPAIFGPLLEQQIPTIHHLGFAQVPYPPTLAPQHPLYHLATASEAVAQAVRDSGLTQLATSTTYPGALVRQFSRPTLPQRDKLRILYAGLVIQSKGPHTLLEALTVLQQQQVDFECTIAGNAIHADYLAALRQYLQQTGLVHRVRLVGHLDRAQLADCFAQHNVFVFPSIQPEAFGIVQVEAMAAGLTVLSTGVGGASEVIESGVSGLLFPAGDALALAQALISLPQDAERWARLAATGQAAAFAKFDIERSIDQLELKFEELLRRKAELSSPMVLSIPTSPATDPYTQWLCDRITNVVRVYGLDPSDQNTLSLLRNYRQMIAEFWCNSPAERLADLYAGPPGQFHRELLSSGLVHHPLTQLEVIHRRTLTTALQRSPLPSPEGLKAFLAVMLYFTPGQMRVADAASKLPAWLLPIYQQYF